MKPRDTGQAVAAKADSPQLPQLLAEAIELLRTGQIDAAEPALQRVLARWPGQPDALHFMGVLRHTQGRTDEGIELIRQALAKLPVNATAWNNLGNILLLSGRAEEAAEAYDKAVEHADPDSAEAPLALNNLGLLYRKLGRLDRSETVLRRALELSPAFGDAWFNLSSTLICQGRTQDGLIAQRKARTLRPEPLQSRQEITRALWQLGERDRAVALLREWLQSEPDNPVARHMLAACVGQAAPERASDGYLQQVFDGFAASFDSRLEALDYRAPGLVNQALADAVGKPCASLDIVDAGCGTGLCAPGLRPFARHLAGCDLSAGMLQRAKSRELYDALHQSELTHFLAAQPEAWDAVVSADTLCYFGALEGALAASHGALRPDGWLVFTLEALPDDHADEHLLQAHGRYAHAGFYLRRALAATGFDLKLLRREPLRMEAGEPVPGWLVGAQRRDWTWWAGSDCSTIAVVATP